MESKPCAECGVTRSLTDYPVDPRQRDGRRGRCFACHHTRYRLRQEEKGRIVRQDWGARFLSHVDDSGDCWLWTGARDGKGYGVLGAGGTEWKAHRLSYALHHGDLPDGAYICHHCDNPPCVNPAHLYAGDAHTNMVDAVARGRHVALRGERCGKAKYTFELIESIRRDYATGQYTQVALAKKYGIGQPHISLIVRRKVWKDAG